MLFFCAIINMVIIMIFKLIGYSISTFFAFIGLVLIISMIFMISAADVYPWNRVYTTARIVSIEEKKDEEGNIDHVVKAEVIRKNEETIEELNFYSDTMKEGKKIEVYYDKNNPKKVSSPEFSSIYIFGIAMGITQIIIGAGIFNFIVWISRHTKNV